MKILILGSSGFLGKLIYKKIKNNFNVINNGLKKKRISLVSFKKTNELLLNINPNLIINCAALTNIDQCEKFPKKSYDVNVKAVENIFKVKKKNNLNFFFIQFSTDSLYDSKNNINNNETKIPKINNIYSRHKNLVEKICLKNKSLIFRTNFFGKYKNNITNWIYKETVSKNKKEINLFDDINFSPLRATKIAEIISYIIQKGYYNKNGIYNLGSRNGLSKYNFAILFLKKLNFLKKKKINKVKSLHYVKVKRSRNMKMSVVKFEKNFKMKLNTLKKEISLCANEY
jgi:dTDP-4-dehydrorhamnose reductase